MIIVIIELIERNQLENLNIKKLTGFKNLYRARVGNFRIIYKIDAGQNKVILVDERNDKTYKNL